MPVAVRFRCRSGRSEKPMIVPPQTDRGERPSDAQFREIHLRLSHVIFVLLAAALAVVALAQHPPRAADRVDHGSVLEADGIATNCLPLPNKRDRRRPTPPPHIRVGKVIYTVELVKEIPAAEETASFSGKTCDRSARRLGACDAIDHIYLETGQTLREEQTTLLHELQHAIFGTEKSDRKTTYHQFMYQLSPRLLEVLQENPDLSFYLMASEAR